MPVKKSTSFVDVVRQGIWNWNDVSASVYNLRTTRYKETYLDAASLVIGVLSIFLWPIPYAGLSVSIIGLGAGILVRRHRKSGMAMTDIVLSAVGFLLTLVNLKMGLLDLILRTYFQY